MSDLPSPSPNDEQLKLLVQEAIKPLVQQAFADYMATRSVFDPEFTKPLLAHFELLMDGVMMRHRMLTNGDIKNIILDIERRKTSNLY